MLFNSHEFLFAFFPTVLVCYWLVQRHGDHARLGVITLASLCFYAWWDVRFVALLLGSMFVNYRLGIWLSTAVARRRALRSNLIVICGVGLNLGVLAFFKYAHFLLDNVNAVAGSAFQPGNIVLPLGISFFTFEQIGYLVDIRRGSVYRASLSQYAVFVSFFPRLVAGPILRYSEIGPQLLNRSTKTLSDDLAVGLTIFFIGLAKKSLLADGIAAYASPVFLTVARGESVDFLFAWGGALAYTCQLYFDFSGYSDMAIGAARCFGIRFPMNFDSPYKATSIIEFWRRWHMTLSRFLRDYLYFSLGGNRRGKPRRYINLLVTMLLGGLWHGASWTFVFWGGLHGIYLVINHGWVALSDRVPAVAAFRRSPMGAPFGFALTFFGVVVAWVFFRAANFNAAVGMLKGMAGLHGIVLPSGLEFAFRPLINILSALGITFGSGSGSQFVVTYLWVSALLGIALLLPNTQELLALFEPVLEMTSVRTARADQVPLIRRLRWAYSPAWAVLGGLIAFLGIVSITRVSEFLYWQF